MCASRPSALWPQLVAISLIGIGVASCSANSGRFGEGFGLLHFVFLARRRHRLHSADRAAASHVDSRPLPNLASADNGASGGGRGMGSYQPGSEVTGSVAAAAALSRPGPGTAARRYGPPWANRRRHRPTSTACRSPPQEANHIASAASVYPGEHLVIPRYRPATAAEMPLPARTATLRRTGGHRALRSAARRLGCAFRFACRGARRNAQQHCAALRQAGHGHCQGQQHSAGHHGAGRRAHRHSGDGRASCAGRAARRGAGRGAHDGSDDRSRRTVRAWPRRAHR